MKYRKDFVTNSSSTSFVVARKEEPTSEQKEAILKLVESLYFSEPILKPGMSDEEIQKQYEDNYLDEEIEIDEIKKLLDQGYFIYQNYLETDDYLYNNFQKHLIKALDRTDEFESIREQFSI